MRSAIVIAALVAAILPLAASAQPVLRDPSGLPLRVRPLDVEVTNSLGGRAPWNAPWQYDSGSGMDRHPELPYYQQGVGQQTGGPARNLLPDDGLHIVPR